MGDWTKSWNLDVVSYCIIYWLCNDLLPLAYTFYISFKLCLRENFIDQLSIIDFFLELVKHGSMQYYSTRNTNNYVSLKQVILDGLAQDGGLYLPLIINPLPQEFWRDVKNLKYIDILEKVLFHLTTGDEIDNSSISEGLSEVFNFSPEIKSLEDNLHLLDLNTGPTSAFKDYGANTLGVYLKVIADSYQSKKTILVATSGDTGSAVANAFKNYNSHPSLNVIVLYPKGRVSEDQRKLMTIVGGNINCIEINGNFDDCQALVKQAMSDKSIRSYLTSANSINLIRIYGQIAYYIYTWAQVSKGEEVIFSVPSGNLGNLTAGYISYLLGNPIKKFIVSHNLNDMFNNLVLEGILKENKQSIPTISSAMDVYKPSNLERLIVLFDGEINQDGSIKTLPDIKKMQDLFYVQGFDDDETKIKMKSIYNNHNQQIDPHTAVGLLGVEHSIKNQHPEFADDTIIVLSTAHASKFNEIFYDVNGQYANLSDPINIARTKQETMLEMYNSYPALKEYILTKIGN